MPPRMLFAHVAGLLLQMGASTRASYGGGSFDEEQGFVDLTDRFQAQPTVKVGETEFACCCRLESEQRIVCQLHVMDWTWWACGGFPDWVLAHDLSPYFAWTSPPPWVEDKEHIQKCMVRETDELLSSFGEQKAPGNDGPLSSVEEKKAPDIYTNWKVTFRSLKNDDFNLCTGRVGTFEVRGGDKKYSVTINLGNGNEKVLAVSESTLVDQALEPPSSSSLLPVCTRLVKLLQDRAQEAQERTESAKVVQFSNKDFVQGNPADKFWGLEESFWSLPTDLDKASVIYKADGKWKVASVNEESIGLASQGAPLKPNATAGGDFAKGPFNFEKLKASARMRACPIAQNDVLRYLVLQRLHGVDELTEKNPAARPYFVLDCYRALFPGETKDQISLGARHKLLKKAWLELAKKFHPDKGPFVDAARVNDAFAKITSAAEQLGVKD